MSLITGKTNEQTVSDTVSARSYQIPCPSASSYFSENDLLFISQDLTTEIEFLGKVTAVDGSSVTGTYPVIQDKSSTYRVWVATSGFQFTNNPNNPLEEDESYNAEIVMSNSGTPYITKIADTTLSRTFQWNDTIRAADIINIRSFRDSLLSSGTAQCTFTDADRCVHSCYLLSFDFPKRATREIDGFNNETNPDYSSREAEYNLTMELLLDTEGEYI